VKAVEEFKGSQVGFLYNILGVRRITRKPTRQIIRGVEMRENSFFEAGGYIFFLQQRPFFLLNKFAPKERPVFLAFYSHKKIFS